MKFNILTALAVCLLWSATATAGTDEEVADNEGLDIALSPPERCINSARIKRTKVIGDQTILFYMKGGDIYRNELPNKCSGLRTNDAFMYRTSVSELCNVDVITVLTRFGGALLPGPSCGLGMFQPIPEGEARVLVEEVARKR